MINIHPKIKEKIDRRLFIENHSQDKNMSR